MKKLMSLVLAMMMVMSLAACGGDIPGTTDSGSKAPETTTDSGSKAPETTADSGKAAETIKMGGIGPLTGDYANYGVSVKQGAEIAVKEINAAGGIAGQQIELSFQDSQGDAESAVNAYGKLLDWGMKLSLGAVFSGETATVCAAAKDDDIMLLTPSGSSDNILESNDKAFRVCFNDGYQGIMAANYIKDKNITDKVAVLYQSDYDYSTGLYESFKKGCEENGIEIVEVQTFTESTKTDFTTQINKLVAADVKLIFIPIYAEPASTFLTQAKGKFGDDVYFFGADGLDGILEKVAQDVTIANNVLMMTPFAADSSDPQVQAFVKAYQEAYNGATPDQFAADGYDAVYILKAAMEKAGSSSGAAMAKAMLELEITGVTGTMKWTEDGNTQKNAMAIIYKDGVGSLFGQ